MTDRLTRDVGTRPARPGPDRRRVQRWRKRQHRRERAGRIRRHVQHWRPARHNPGSAAWPGHQQGHRGPAGRRRDAARCRRHRLRPALLGQRRWHRRLRGGARAHRRRHRRVTRRRVSTSRLREPPRRSPHHRRQLRELSAKDRGVRGVLHPRMQMPAQDAEDVLPNSCSTGAPGQLQLWGIFFNKVELGGDIGQFNPFGTRRSRSWSEQRTAVSTLRTGSNRSQSRRVDQHRRQDQ